MLQLDIHGIYGHRVWMLYKDVCRQNLVDMIGILRAVQLGILPEATLNRAIDGDRNAVDVPAEMALVRGCLIDFQSAD